MEELILEYGWDILTGVGAALFGAAAVFLVYKVAERITKSNIADIIRQAIHRKKSDIAKKAIGQMVGTYVKEAKPNEITLSVLISDCKELEGQEIKIESSQGVDPSIQQGMKVKFTL